MNRLELPLPPITIADRQQPYAPEAEISVLGGMLQDGEAVPKALEIVREDMFYREANRRVFAAMMRLYRAQQIIDPVTLREELDKTDDLDAIGGQVYIGELLDAVPTAANIEYHARIVRDRAILRRLINAGSEMIRDSYEPGPRTISELLDRAEQRVFEVSQSHERKGFVWIKEVLKSTFEVIEKYQHAAGGITGVETGIYKLDDLTGGFQRGDLIIVAARPSMGKTALVTGIALHAAIEKRVAVGMYSLEMSQEQIVQRMLCHEGLVDLSRLRRGQLSDQDYTRLAYAAGILNLAPIWIDDSGLLNELELRAKARRLKASNPDLGLIVVDYIQLMQSSKSVEKRYQEVSEISRGLKALAKELDLPIIALSQLSRATEQRTDKRPQLSDLRESGALEQDADVVLFLHRPERYVTEMEAREKDMLGKAELIIGKQRNGPTGSIDLFFRKESTKFENMTEQQAPAHR
jgi:replicative DNA helicase